MAFNSEAPRAEFTATASQTLFTFLFKIYDKTDLKVYQTPIGDEPNDVADLLTVDIDYTVVITGDTGGSITLAVDATAGDTLVLLRELAKVRDVEYQTNGDLLAETLNDDQNYQTYLIADLGEASERSMILSESSVNVSNSMPPVQSQQFLRWNAAGTALENSIAVVQEITEFNDTDFRIVSTGNLKLIYDLAALMANRTWTVPDKDIDFGEFYTKTESDAITDLKLDETATAQTKLGDITIGESITVSSWSFVTTTITLNTAVAHNLSIGQYFNISGLVATTNAPNGRWVVATVVDADTITFTAVDTPTGTPTVSSALLEHGDITLHGAFKKFSLGQTWQDMTASRAIDGTVYTNTDENPIEVLITVSVSINANSIIVDGVPIGGSVGANMVSASFSVDPGEEYSVTGSTTFQWAERRKI